MHVYVHRHTRARVLSQDNLSTATMKKCREHVNEKGKQGLDFFLKDLKDIDGDFEKHLRVY